MEAQVKPTVIVLLITLSSTLSSASYDFVVKPEFVERPNDLNITSYVGQTSRLPCTVRHLSGKRVSWIRQRDLQVLSTGRVTFSTDLRISVLPGTRSKLRRPTRELPLQQTLPRDGNKPFGNPGSDKGQREWAPCISTSSCLLVNDTSWQEDGELSSIPDPDVRIKASSTLLLEDKESENQRYEKLYRLDFGKRKKNHGWRDAQESSHSRQRREIPMYDDNENPWKSRKYTRNTHYHKRKGHRSRSKKAVSYKNHDIGGQVKSLGSFPAAGPFGRSIREMTYDDKKDNNPIAIYPQGPISIASEAKSLKLAPNYIDGVWEPEDYTLQIRFTKPQDAGIYMCQINTEPRISQAVVLRVVKMRAEIVGSRELFVKAGNPVKLSCRVNHGALSPGFILWYKGERLVEYENSGGRIQVLTEAGGVSHLILNNAQPADSSNYTCSPAGGAPASLSLNVIIDERQAAMQQGNHCPSVTPQSASYVLWCVAVSLHILWSYAQHSYLMPSSLFAGIMAAVIIVIPKYMLKIFISVFLLSLSVLLVFLKLSIPDKPHRLHWTESDSVQSPSSDAAVSSQKTKPLLSFPICNKLLVFERHISTTDIQKENITPILKIKLIAVGKMSLMVIMTLSMFYGINIFFSDVI